MNIKTLLTAILFYLISAGLYAQTGKNIRGSVIDEASGKPLPYVNIHVLDYIPVTGTTSDENGNFTIAGLPVGRYNIQATFMGYEPTEYKEIIVSSSKEAFVNILMRESIISLNEVVIKAKVNKQEPLNTIATASARMLSTDEASRYAGGFDDPARLVTSFAGVAGNISSNGIAIRGNSPQFLQWRLEGAEIPNPTHFSDVTAVGGGILTALSSQVLGNSDFFTGAFPAEYTNALSGVFDMQLREGNRWDYEHTIQVGTMGIDLSSEGPLKKGGQASYLFNYRYSTMALANDLFPGLLNAAGGLRYQDLSFKINFPTKKAGTFSVWGVGIIDKMTEHEKTDTTERETAIDNIRTSLKQKMGAGGFGHKYFINDNIHVKSVLAGTFTNNYLNADFYNDEISFSRIMEMEGTNANILLSSYLNTKFGAKHTNRTGLKINGLYYNLDYNMSPSFPNAGEPMENFAKGKGHTFLLSAFSNSTIRLKENITANIGVSGQYFLLNKNWSIEPRIGVKWQINALHSLGIAYGKHSRHEKLDYYYVTTPESNGELVNKNLDFIKAHHLVLSYDWSLSENLHLKIEPYFQYLYDVPVERDSLFSIINHEDWYLTKALVNDGKGVNYGIDLTLERYLADGYYYLFTASVFQSRYQGGDGVWRNTRLNRNFLINALVGKEWKVGCNKQNILSINIRLSYQGGERYIPVNELASEQQHDVIYDMSRAFESQLKPAFISNLTASYKINKKSMSHEFAVKIINATGYKEFEGFFYNYRLNKVESLYSMVVMPGISYKFEF